VHQRSGSGSPLLRSSLFWVVTQRRSVVTDVSGQRIGPIFKGQVVQAEDYFLERQMSQ
jgi:hypothetical protein